MTGEEEKKRASQERGSRKLKRKGKEEEEAEGREYWEGGLRKSWRKGRKNKQWREMSPYWFLLWCASGQMLAWGNPWEFLGSGCFFRHLSVSIETKNSCFSCHLPGFSGVWAFFLFPHQQARKDPEPRACPARMGLRAGWLLYTVLAPSHSPGLSPVPQNFSSSISTDYLTSPLGEHRPCSCLPPPPQHSPGDLHSLTDSPPKSWKPSDTSGQWDSIVSAFVSMLKVHL